MHEKFQSKLLKLFFTLLLGFATLTSFGQIIISQVYNGVNNNKCIEITNIGDDLDLSFPVQYKIGLWANSGTTGNASISGNPTGFLNLSGTLTQGQKCVISNSGSTASINNFNVLLITNNAVTTFDGNDGLAIFRDTNTLIDTFGVGINYNSISYERQEQVVSPKPDFRIPEWISKTLAQFDVAGGQDNTVLGLHYFDACYFIITNMLGSLNTTYGTPSVANSFVVAYKSFRHPRNIAPPGVTPTNLTVPSGFEISSVSNFASNVYAGGTTFEPVDDGSGNPVTYYLRIAATTSPGNHSGSVFITKFNPYEDVYLPTDAVNTVDVKSITVAGLVANNKVNDGTTTATLRGNAVLSGVFAADLSNVVLEGTPTANFNDPSTGNNKPVTVTGYTISGARSGYYILNQPTGLTANITDVDVPLTAQNITFNALTNVVYGSSNFNLTATASSGLSVTYTSSNPNVAIVIGNTVTLIGIGTTTITATQFGDSVYGVAPPVNQLLTVIPKQLTATATVANKIYDRTNVATISGSLVGVVGSDVVTFIGSGTFATANAGNGIAVTSTSTLGGANVANYTLTQPTGLTANIIVKPLTVLATATNKIYDRTTAASITGTLVGVLGADIVTFNGIGTFASVNAGTGIVVTSASTLTGANSANYSLTQPTGLSATITKKALTIAGAVAANKSFDGTTVATITGTLSGIIAPDVVTLVATGTFASSAIGNGIAVTSTSTLTGAAAANYSLTQPVGLTANITGPTVLAVGDLSIIGFQFTVSNSFAFVCWVDISTNTYIKFTDNAFLSSGSANATTNARGGENFVIWRNNGPTIPAGTITTIRDVNTAASSNRGIIVSGNLNGLSLSGDTIFAYQGAATSGTTPDWNANTNPTTFTGTVLFGLYGQGTSSFTTWITSGGASSNNSYLPSQLNVTNGNIALASLASRGQYTGSRSNQTSFNAYRALVTNPTNWTTAPGAGTITLNTTVFTLPLASTAAVISGANSICSGNATNLKVAITGGTGPFKVVYSDGTSSFTVNNYVSNANIAVAPSVSTTYSLVSVTDSNNFIGTGNSGSAIITVIAPTTIGSESISFCGASYTWPTSGLTYITSGVYTKIVGCNTATLTLTLNTNFQTLYVDADGDGFGSATTILSCAGQPLNTATNSLDCNDNLASVNPNASEVLGNGIDDNCDGTVDEVTALSSLTVGSCNSTLVYINGAIFAYPMTSFPELGTIQAYRFRVTDGASVRTYDSATNSFNLLNLQGGATYGTVYTVEVSVKSGGYFRAYGSSCTLTTPTVPNTAYIANPVCGATLTDINQSIFCNAVAGASGYRFRVRNGATLVGVVNTTVNRFSLVTLGISNIAFGTTYTVDVLLAFGGVSRPDTEYGDPCSITTPATPGTSRVIQPTCGSTINALWTTIFAQQVVGAQGYKFVVTNGAQTREYATANPRFQLPQLAGGAAANTVYTIRVDVLYNLSYVQGTVLCTITTTAVATRQTSTALAIYEVNAYPNPYGETFKLNVNTSSEDQVGVRVYDMLGREVETRQATVAAITNLEIGSQYPSGVYNIIVTQGSNVKTLRVIKR